MVLMIIAGTYAASLRQRQHRLESLRAERQRIELDLQRVKALADQSQPVVVLENGDTRLIVNHQDPKPQPEPPQSYPEHAKPQPNRPTRPEAVQGHSPPPAGWPA